MLHVSSHMLPSLYDGTPKILVVKSRLANLPAFIPSTHHMTWLVAETADGKSFNLADNRATSSQLEQSEIELPPANVWVVWSRESDVPLTNLADWWLRSAGADTIPAFVHGDAAALNAALVERSLVETDRLTKANQLLIEDLAALRESWAHHVRLPPELEELLTNLRVAPAHLVFETPAAKGNVTIPDNGSLRQRLPIGARGFLGIDLHIEAPGSGDGDLRAVLTSSDSEAELAHWKIPYRTLQKGWLPLRLPVASALMARALELRIKSTGGTSAPRLSCTPAGLLGEYAFTGVNEGDSAGAMLALKLWGGIPGLNHTAGSDAAPLPPQPILAIPEHLVANAQSTRELTWAYPHFGYIDSGWVLLRPLRITPSSAACLSLPAIPGLSAVSCQARIDNGQCKIRHLVRLAISLPGANVDDVEEGTSALASSEWIELAEPLKAFTLTANLPKPESGPVEVHFFSRLPQGGTLEQGRVVFGCFEARIDERATWPQGPIMPEG